MIGAVGIPLNQLASNDITLVMNIIDRSGSMYEYAPDLINAYNNQYLAAMTASASADDILVSAILFDSRINLLHGYLNLADAPQLSADNYAPHDATALYDAVAAGISNMTLYAQQLRSGGVAVRCLIVVYSDGEDNASKQRAASVKKAAKDLLQHEMYTLAYVGFKSGGISEAELRKLADTIGFPDILIAGASADQLRRIFRLSSMNAISVSRGALARQWSLTT